MSGGQWWSTSRRPMRGSKRSRPKTKWTRSVNTSISWIRRWIWRTNRGRWNAWIEIPRLGSCNRSYRSSRCLQMPWKSKKRFWSKTSQISTVSKSKIIKNECGTQNWKIKRKVWKWPSKHSPRISWPALLRRRRKATTLRPWGERWMTAARWGNSTRSYRLSSRRRHSSRWKKTGRDSWLASRPTGTSSFASRTIWRGSSTGTSRMCQCPKPSLIGFRVSANAWWSSQPINRKFKGSRWRKFSAKRLSRTQTIRSRNRLRTKRR